MRHFWCEFHTLWFFQPLFMLLRTVSFRRGESRFFLALSIGHAKLENVIALRHEVVFSRIYEALTRSAFSNALECAR